MDWSNRALSRPSNWEIVTSAGIGANIGEIIMAGGNLSCIYVSQNADAVTVTPMGMSGPVTKLWFLGAGLGIGVGVPIDAFASSEDMPSGGMIYYGGLAKKGQPLTIDDLTGPCSLTVTSAGLFASVSATIIRFNIVVGGPPMASTAIGVLLGAGLETPGVGSVEYLGALWRGAESK